MLREASREHKSKRRRIEPGDLRLSSSSASSPLSPLRSLAPLCLIVGLLLGGLGRHPLPASSFPLQPPSSLSVRSTSAATEPASACKNRAEDTRLYVLLSTSSQSQQQQQQEEHHAPEVSPGASKRATSSSDSVSYSFWDTAKICVAGGNGGNGCVSFRREKGQARGGPNGGRGGEGGSVFLEASRRVQTLVQCKQTVHVRASHGKNGQGKMKNGVAGNDVVIQVPLGTIARELSTQRVAAELALDGQRLLGAGGGGGGRGNAAFQTHCRTAPKLCEKGAPGASRWLELELRLLAEVGFLGLPNAGKSTLLAATSAATPKIANYPFTTLIPHLGVCNLPHHHPAEGMVLCDIPGLIPGASQGAGMGLHFLRHVQRCKVLLHVLDGSSDDVVANFHALQNELSLYDPVVLARKPQVIVVNKLDLPEVDERKEDLLQQLREASGHSRVVAISAATMQGVPELFMRLSKLVAAEEAAAKLQTSEPGTVDTADVLDRALLVKERPAEKVPEISFEKTGLDFPPDDFSLESDPSYPGQWRIKGEYIEAVAQMTHWEYPEALERFGRQLEAIGVADALIRRGAKEGDLIMIDKYDFDFSPGRTNPYIPAELLEQEQDHFATSSKKRVQSNDDEAQNSWRPFTQGGYLDMDVSELSGFAEERGESEELDGSWDDLFRLDGEIHEGEFLLDDQDDIWMS